MDQIVLYNDSSLTKEKKLSLLILVLLEIVFGNNNIIFDKIVKYLIGTNLIDQNTQSNEFLSTRTKLFNMIVRLNSSSPLKQITNGCDTEPNSFTPINTY